jgi:uncharacterized protein YdeI (YjbR/CyaY-like superfamily)
MGKRDKRVDQYIEKSAEFARPILQYLRELVHEACPEVEEEMKWSSPHFTYKGMFVGMAAFQSHCAFGFWKHELVMGANSEWKEAMGSFGRITSLADLPPKRVLASYIKAAKKLNDDGVKAVRRKMARAPIPTPPELAAALKKNKKARATYEGFSPSNRRDYDEWIADAKGEDTRARRLATAIEWLSEGKTRNWKYQKC